VPQKVWETSLALSNLDIPKSDKCTLPYYNKKF
jgi:hypothetical protein